MSKKAVVWASKTLFAATNLFTIASLALSLLPRRTRVGASRPNAGAAFAILLVGSCGPIARSLGRDWSYPGPVDRLRFRRSLATRLINDNYF